MEYYFQTNIFTLSRKFFALNKTEVREMRKNRLREIEMFEIIYEIFVHVLFFWILYVVCYSNTNTETFKFQRSMNEMFVSPNLKYDFNKVNLIYSAWFI